MIPLSSMPAAATFIGLAIAADPAVPGHASLTWFLTALAFLFAGAFVATVRKALNLFSRVRLQERLPVEQRERFAVYVDRLEDYSSALRLLDQVLRLGLVAASVFVFTSSAVGGARGTAPDSVAAVAAVVALIIGVVVVGFELIPGILARVAPERLMVTVLPLLNGLYALTARPLRFFGKIMTGSARILGSPPPPAPEAIVHEEILAAAEDGQREGVILDSELSMIEGIIRFRDGCVSEALTPRTEMVALDVTTPIPDCIRLARECGHSRLPVFRGNKDAIVGILYVKDLLRFWDERLDGNIELESIIRRAHFVPETKKVSELFQEFKTQRFHIAIVQDEFGGTAGLITIEDIIEDILGEIEEENPEVGAPDRLVRIRDDLFEIDARFPIEDFNAELGEELAVELPEDDGFETLGGFLFNSMGKIPGVGETYRFRGLIFEVVDADERMVRRVRVRQASAEAEAARGRVGDGD